MRVVVEQVVQTASRVLEHQLSAREAATILATLTREAVATASGFCIEEPERAAAYRELIIAIGRELQLQACGAGEAGYVRAVADDLERLVQALHPR